MTEFTRLITDSDDTTERHYGTAWSKTQVDSALGMDLVCGEENERNICQEDGICGDGSTTEWSNESIGDTLDPEPCEQYDRSYICQEDIEGDYTVVWVESEDENSDPISKEANYNDGGPDVSFTFDDPPGSGTDIYLKWIGCDTGFQSIKTSYRFPNVVVPSGATIDSAFLQLKASANTSDPINVNIYGEATASATQITTYSDFDNRVRTSGSVEWDLPTGTSWTSDTFYNSPDIKTVVDEIMTGSGGWTSGNAMQFFIEDNTTASGYYREAYMDASYSGTQLLINYTEAAPAAPTYVFQLKAVSA